MSAGLDASTVTPGRTAPLESLTTPAISAFWANALTGRSSNAISSSREPDFNRGPILSPPMSLAISPSFVRARLYSRLRRWVKRIVEKEPSFRVRSKKTMASYGGTARAKICAATKWERLATTSLSRGALKALPGSRVVGIQLQRRFELGQRSLAGAQ